MPGLGVLSSAGIGLGATLLSKLLETKTWTLLNEDTGEAIKGQFPDAGNSFDFSSSWGEIKSLNRASPLLQYLHGETDTFDVSAQFFRRDITDESPHIKLEKLLSFCRRDQRFGRPPICRFAIGDGSVVNLPVILYKVGGINYSQPDFLGGIRQVTFSLHFQKFTRFSLSDEAVTDTRYHRTVRGQYYELIAGIEYGDPMLGDVIRKQPEQVGKALLVPGNIVKLPALEGVKDKQVTQTSTILKSAFGRRDTIQKQRFEQMLELLSDPSIGTPVETSGIDFGSPPIPIQVPVDGDGFGSGNFGSAPFGSG
jgi:hypothetical protein